MDASFLFSQFMGGLTAAMFLFLIASGLSLVFGVMRVLNFAHGSFYMIGAYLAWQVVNWLQPMPERFWPAVLAASFGVALLGAIVERRCWSSAMPRNFCGARSSSRLSRPPVLGGGIEIFGTLVPHYNLFIMLFGPLVALSVWLMLTRTTMGRMVRAAALDREMLGALGANVGWLYTGMFALASFLAGLSGALVTPIQSIVPGMDVEIIVQAFIVVVIGGLGSFWGTFLGSVIYGQVLSFGILIFPGFSLFSVFALMAVILILRPWGLLGRPLR